VADETWNRNAAKATELADDERRGLREDRIGALALCARFDCSIVNSRIIERRASLISTPPESTGLHRETFPLSLSLPLPLPLPLPPQEIEGNEMKRTRVERDDRARDAQDESERD